MRGLWTARIDRPSIWLEADAGLRCTEEEHSRDVDTVFETQ